MITGYNGTFTKKNGESREMFFAHLKDLPEEAFDELVGDSNTGGRTLPDGMELVFDIQSHDLRVFNHKTLRGSLEPFEVEVEDYWSK